ncbi:hypothetical protein [Euzebya rosea]|uniref:hypothetical protein n=1 Tax=Euzebya rosea TaxID=2052804 RepID=UPI0013007A53|nr:hypothetical protein [Euzebya rosea]
MTHVTTAEAPGAVRRDRGRGVVVAADTDVFEEMMLLHGPSGARMSPPGPLGR